MPRKELEEVPKGQMEDPMQEEAARSRSKEEQAKRAYLVLIDAGLKVVNDEQI